MPPFPSGLLSLVLRRVSTPSHVPGLHLRSDSGISSRPVRSCAPALRPVSRPAGDVPHTKPVARSNPEIPCLRPDFRLPFGTSRSLRFNAPAWFQTAKLAFASCPIFLHSPLRRKIFSYRPAHRIVQDPLPPARLAVLRTSWNRTHHAPGCSPGQGKIRASDELSSENIPLWIQRFKEERPCMKCG